MPSCPAAIEVLGPPPTSGTRDAFVEMVMDEGAAEFDSIKAMKKTDEKKFKAVCETVREDGAYIEAGENDNLIVQKLEANPKSFGIFGFSFLDQNADKIQGSVIEGEAPTFESNRLRQIRGFPSAVFLCEKRPCRCHSRYQEYLAEFTSEKAWGKEGYLAEKGLIPSPRLSGKPWQPMPKP